MIDGSVKYPLAAAPDRVLTSHQDDPKEETKMAELTINTADIAAALEEEPRGLHARSRGRPGRSRASRWATASPRVSGLPGVGVNELLEFEGGILGLALNLDEDSIGAVILGDGGAVRRGLRR